MSLTRRTFLGSSAVAGISLFDPNIVLEQAVYAELSAIARTAPDKARAQRGFRTLDPAGRPT